MTIESLLAEGYLNPRLLGDGRWTAVLRLMFTWAIVIGPIHDSTGYDERWCYHDALTAITAQNVWDGHGDPLGWHRHPSSGRRISEDGQTYDERGNLVPIGQEYVRQ